MIIPDPALKLLHHWKNFTLDFFFFFFGRFTHSELYSQRPSEVLLLGSHTSSRCLQGGNWLSGLLTNRTSSSCAPMIFDYTKLSSRRHLLLLIMLRLDPLLATNFLLKLLAPHSVTVS